MVPSIGKVPPAVYFMYVPVIASMYVCMSVYVCMYVCLYLCM